MLICLNDPMLGNWIDLIIIFFLIIHFADGVKRGFYSIVVNMGSFLFSLFISFLTYSYSASFFTQNFAIETAYANIMGFFLNMFIIKFILLVVSRRALPDSLFIINRSIKRRAASGFAAFSYSAIVVFLLMSITFAFSLPHFLKNEFNFSTVGNFVVKDPIRINNGLHNIFGDALSVTMDKLDFLTVETGDEKRIDLGFTVSDLSINKKLENDMLELINKERSLAGRKDLVADEMARETARKHGIDMFNNGYFSHIDLEKKGPSDRMKESGVEFNFSGENLALSKDLPSAHQGLMNSPGHKKNILHPFFHRVGIGVIDGGEYGMIFVQNFAD
ncbi:MAG: CvpA family protein [Candidatus Pacebacteria bacterium]|nr:CvpA family protein [Candidatus Paceibacterota bacterium]